MRLNKLSVVVTGGGSGLGAAVCGTFAAEGATVNAVDLKFSGAAPAGVGRHEANVCSAEGLASVFDGIAKAPGRLDVLVCCAGIAPAQKVVGKEGAHPLDTFSRVIDVNLNGTFNAVRLAAQLMSRNAPGPGGERGVIIMTASVAAYDGRIGQAAYAASKGGVVSMTLPLARELARHGIRICTVAPGIFETPMLMEMPQVVRDALGAMVPFPSRLGRPEEFAGLCRHIVENDMLNGEVIRLDGAIRMAAR
ncbi:SDR family NAD(P)-dependent oxidoreductase [Noviherbaspirillum denitrificans]|uniref:3-hydroxy-2-methylbutyryl-CoA dehydrogenase n=1 Tax=Noviherbaspirillum denitrificans TaxID=1968433 RepID=A0A254TH61_9BURK|nr:SDR family NAD(P)-dependent oxidoreductase [Noviherbaspirillum denitrificans]OWW20642.1 3-hydroxy-2-methylbutyryl-CoA dehydrogenase [Noviherbaspirillum denitrificans]